MEYLIYSVEDDYNIAKIIQKALSKQDCKVETFYDGKSFLARLKNQKPNLILLDMMLPDIQGQELLKKVRNQIEYDDIDIIIISANVMVMDKVDGLDLGADDYIEKPFNILELISRVNARQRRFLKKNIIQLQDIEINLNTRKIRRDEKDISLTSREYDIFEILIKKRGKVITREYILDMIWGSKEIETRALDMHIKSLREKLGPDSIKTIYGVGFLIE